MSICCRNCGVSFSVAFSRPSPSPSLPLAELIETRQLSYGDPQNTTCCPKGMLAGSVTKKVLEYWHELDTRAGWIAGRLR